MNRTIDTVLLILLAFLFGECSEPVRASNSLALVQAGQIVTAAGGVFTMLVDKFLHRMEIENE